MWNGWSSGKLASEIFKTARAAAHRYLDGVSGTAPCLHNHALIKPLTLTNNEAQQWKSRCVRWQETEQKRSAQNQRRNGEDRVSPQTEVSTALPGIPCRTLVRYSSGGSKPPSPHPSAKSASSHDLGPLNQKLLTSTQQTWMPDY